jgi:aldehyde:ferredoxin oxidoreductase
MKLRAAGYEGLVIRGKADGPVYVEIMDGIIKIKDASPLWAWIRKKCKISLTNATASW